ncbi:hypothetical protein AYR55_03805 [Loigolactobacillus backii]|uniref:hypothetical protein n=1 Tax=Loigolactobacillus backii TaxID=375175 RepID=UPI0007F0E346|nr:hypothetical protein [Loigolactobacillus backii]ANK66905.1 hypothetical protein AYR55_03805 [Loigolactobacillus backii]
MAFVELENGGFINVNLIETLKFSVMQKRHEPDWIAYFDTGMQRITDADRIHILETAGFVKIKKEKDDEQ